MEKLEVIAEILSPLIKKFEKQYLNSNLRLMMFGAYIVKESYFEEIFNDYAGFIKPKNPESAKKKIVKQCEKLENKLQNSIYWEQNDDSTTVHIRNLSKMNFYRLGKYAQIHHVFYQSFKNKLKKSL